MDEVVKNLRVVARELDLVLAGNEKYARSILKALLEAGFFRQCLDEPRILSRVAEMAKERRADLSYVDLEQGDGVGGTFTVDDLLAKRGDTAIGV